jgi:thioredoxin reductase (NADPH)
VVEGSIIASRRDGLGRERVFATGGQGQFSGEVSDLAGHASLAVVCAGPDGCTAYPFDLPRLRALLISSADIGEMMMRAFILRRAALLEKATALVRSSSEKRGRWTRSASEACFLETVTHTR